MMPRKKKSICWKLFTHEKGKSVVQCDICKAELSYTQRTTTNLLRHLQVKHPKELAPHLLGESNVSSSISWLLTAGPDVKCTASIDEVINSSVQGRSDPNASSNSNVQKSPALKYQAMTQALERSLKYKPESQRKTDLDRYVVDLITQDLQPISMLASKAFKRLVHALDPRYDLVSRERLTFQLLPTRYNQEKLQLMDELREIDSLSISVDLWNSGEADSFMTVTAHYITPSWVVKVRVLETKVMCGSYTADNVADNLKVIIHNWEINEKVTTLVGGNTTCMKAVCELLQLRHHACFAHSLNSAIKDSITSVPQLMEAKNRVKDIISYFHRSFEGSQTLQRVQELRETKGTTLPSEVDARWNSVYEMLKLYLDQHGTITNALCLIKRSDMCIRKEEREILEEAVNILEPFYEVTMELSSEKHTSLSKVLPLVTLLGETMESEYKYSTLACNLQTNLQKHFPCIEETFYLQHSTLLDVRFMKAGFPSQHSVETAVERLKEMADSVKLSSDSSSNADNKQTTNQQITSSSPRPKKRKSLWDDWDQKVQGHGTGTMPSSTEAHLEVLGLLESAPLRRSDNPLRWWKTNESLYPRLGVIARDILAIPATSVPSERLFCKAGESISARRSLLEKNQVDMILFLNGIE